VAILAQVTWSRARLLDESISLKFLLETRLKSKSSEPLISFLAFLVQELKKNFLCVGFQVFCE